MKLRRPRPDREWSMFTIVIGKRAFKKLKEVCAMNEIGHLFMYGRVISLDGVCFSAEPIGGIDFIID